MVQWLRLQAPDAGGPGTPQLKIPCAATESWRSLTHKIFVKKLKGCVWQQLIAVRVGVLPSVVTRVHPSASSKENGDAITGENEPEGEWKRALARTHGRMTSWSYATCESFQLTRLYELLPQQ